MKVAIILFTIIALLYAQTQMTSDEIQSVLNVHNQARAAVCLGGLVWDDAAASVAQKYLDNNGGQCPSGHSTQSSRDASYKSFGGTCANPSFPYCSTAMLGENIASGSIGFYSAADLTNLWIGEKAQFQCGSLPSYQSSSGHYSQVVWSGTTKVGCGIRDCPDGFTTLLCNYYPPGNFNSGSTLAFPAANCNGKCSNNVVPSTIASQKPTSTGPATRVIPNPTTPQITKSQPPSSFGSFSSVWSAVEGTLNDWSLSSSVVLSHVASAFSVIYLQGPKASTASGTDVFIVADIDPQSSTKYGMAINVKTGSEGLQFHNFKYDNGAYKICYAFADRPYYDCCGVYKQTPQPGLFMMRHTIVGTKHYYRGYIGGQALSTYILDNTWGGGNQGISAQGNANFNSFYVRTPTSVTITLSSCSMSTSDITNMVANQLGIDSSLVVGVQNLGCTKKRSIQSATVSVVIVGTEESTSLELANQLKSYPNPSMTSVTIESSSISDVIAESESAIVLNPTPLSTAGTGLSVGAIAGIAAGSAVGAVAIAVGIYFAAKSKNNDSQVKEPTVVIQDQEMNVPATNDSNSTPKVIKGVDVFNMDPNNPQSLTARNPHINVQVNNN
jgi:pathogenesis-related protein 1